MERHLTGPWVGLRPHIFALPYSLRSPNGGDMVTISILARDGGNLAAEEGKEERSPQVPQP
ncbi:hypothetical protein E2562_016952 [Oryza meyeriana var. granulata]|uniref:Uncharacterized protein n=1 Tax=Oryza meyeriana var. granulata TaxID=110450 RepID=A0A6G1DWC9_9ORYZ|nr:hypothetical protein E2562_016952 [Oryza meyeriana var. granulata]